MRIKNDLSPKELIKNMEEIKHMVDRSVSASQMERWSRLISTCDYAIRLFQELENEPKEEKENWFSKIFNKDK